MREISLDAYLAGRGDGQGRAQSLDASKSVAMQPNHSRKLMSHLADAYQGPIRADKLAEGHSVLSLVLETMSFDAKDYEAGNGVPGALTFDNFERAIQLYRDRTGYSEKKIRSTLGQLATSMNVRYKEREAAAMTPTPRQVAEAVKSTYQRLQATYEFLIEMEAERKEAERKEADGEVAVRSSQEKLNFAALQRESVGYDCAYMLRVVNRRILPKVSGVEVFPADLEDLQTELLGWISKVEHGRLPGKAWTADLVRFMQILEHYDGSPADDLNLLVIGSKLVVGMLGNDSLGAVNAVMCSTLPLKHILGNAFLDLSADLARQSLAVKPVPSHVLKRWEESGRNYPTQDECANYAHSNAATFALHQAATNEGNVSELLASADRIVQDWTAYGDKSNLLKSVTLCLNAVRAELEGIVGPLEAQLSQLDSKSATAVAEVLFRFIETEDSEPLQAIVLRQVRALRPHAMESIQTAR